jgi:segregation and condensation protein A
MLEIFEGPLDLLLYLIRKQNFNVLDIPMSVLTTQYMAYIEKIHRHNFELAAEYLLMAAMLIEIKSRMLLPPVKIEGEAEPNDPRAELVRRLLEYEQMKLAAQALDALPQIDRDIFEAHAVIEKTANVAWPDIHADDLKKAWLDILNRSNLHIHHTIKREYLLVRDVIPRILRQLQHKKFVEFSELFTPILNRGLGPAVLVVYFIALLELSREQLITLTQAEPYAPIYIRLAYIPHSVSVFQ